MKKLIIVSIILLIANIIYAQHTFKAVIKSENDRLPLPGTSVMVKGLHKTVISYPTANFF